MGGGGVAAPGDMPRLVFLINYSLILAYHPTRIKNSKKHQPAHIKIIPRIVFCEATVRKGI